MSKGRTQNSDSETQFLRSCHETLRDMDKACYTYTRVLLKPAKQLGVFSVEVDTWLVADGKAVSRLVVSHGSFPNSQAKGMAAYLYALAASHVLRVEETLKQDAADIAKQLFRPE